MTSEQEYLICLLNIMPKVHLYWCPRGMHFGVTPFTGPFCPMGCYR